MPPCLIFAVTTDFVKIATSSSASFRSGEDISTGAIAERLTISSQYLASLLSFNAIDILCIKSARDSAALASCKCAPGDVALRNS